MRPYELMYLVQPTADDERIGAISDRIQQTITGAGGKIEKVNIIGRRRLAYVLSAGPLLAYESGFLALFAIPLFAREWDRSIGKRLARHALARRFGACGPSVRAPIHRSLANRGAVSTHSAVAAVGSGRCCRTP